MRILVAPQEFKGSLTAEEAAAAIARGLKRALPEARVDTLPLADGGPGTVDALVHATSGRFVESDARDPLGRPIRARWGVLGDGETAVIEMAAASGLALLGDEERDPARTSTAGTGDLLRAALDAGLGQLLIGMGGSATNDGGAGFASALGARLLGADGGVLPPGGLALARLARVDVGELDARLREARIVVATDVTNPLCGPDGASLIYGPQKGASQALARELDAALLHYAQVLARDLSAGVADIPGAGAAGGLAAALVAFCGATIRSGFDVVAEAVGLAERIERVDVVITGEGRLDRQSTFGKATTGVARMAEAAGKPVLALVGSIQDGAAAEAFDAVFTVVPQFAGSAEAMARAGELLAEVAKTKVAPWIKAYEAS